MDKTCWTGYTKRSSKDTTKTRKHGNLFRLLWDNSLLQIEPLSIRSLGLLCDNMLPPPAVTSCSDVSAVTGLFLVALPALLSNVNSLDENLPIVPLHTSFRDFLTEKVKSGEFCVNVP